MGELFEKFADQLMSEQAKAPSVHVVRLDRGETLDPDATGTAYLVDLQGEKAPGAPGRHIEGVGAPEAAPGPMKTVPPAPGSGSAPGPGSGSESVGNPQTGVPDFLDGNAEPQETDPPVLSPGTMADEIPNPLLKKILYRAHPTPSRFHVCDDFVRALVGPFGSGKSVSCVMEILLQAARQTPDENGVRASRWLIARNSYRELQDTTIKTWFDWVPRELGEWRQSDMAHIIRFNDVHLEVLFRSLDQPDDIGKLLSLELTGAWMNEAREMPKAVFDAVQGRIGRYPRGGGNWNGLVLDSNPSDTDHWFYRVFNEDRVEGYVMFRQPSGLAPDAENLNNLPPDYYTKMARGKDKNWVDMYVHGNFCFVTDGRPIYPEYNDEVHCPTDPISYDPNYPLVVGLDFGLTPAAVICQHANGQWRVLDEVCAEDMGAVRFAPLLKRHLQVNYPNAALDIWGDPGGHRSQTDELTPFQVLAGCGLQAMPALTNDPMVRREAVARNLVRLTMTGVPGLVVAPRCKMVRKGFLGGYAYRRLKVSGDERYTDKPDKNAYSHPHDALQYALVGGGEGDRLMYHRDKSWGEPLKYGTCEVI